MEHIHKKKADQARSKQLRYALDLSHVLCSPSTVYTEFCEPWKMLWFLSSISHSRFFEWSWIKRILTCHVIVTRLMPDDTRSERPEDVARRDLTRRRKSFSRPTLKKRRPPRSNHCCHQTDDEVTLLYIPPTTLSSERANDSTTVIICVFTELCIITIIITCYNNKIWVCNKSYRIFVCSRPRREYFHQHPTMHQYLFVLWFELD